MSSFLGLTDKVTLISRENVLVADRQMNRLLVDFAAYGT